MTDRIAKEDFVTAQINALIAAAPGALDTLDELAAALGDDANFAATVTTSLAGKQPLDGELTAIAGLTSAADRLPYFTGSGAAALATFTAAGRALVDDADAAAQLVTLGAAKAVAEGRSNNTFEMAWIAPGNGYLGMGTAALGADTTYYNPILVATSITIDRIAVEVTSAGAAGKVTRLGIYNADTSWQPTTLLLDAGTVVADATGVKAATVNQVLAPGRYLLVCNSDGTPTLRTARTDSRYMGLAAAIGSSAFFARAATTGQAIATTAYPGTGAAWSNYTGSSVGFDNNVFVRVSTP